MNDKLTILVTSCDKYRDVEAPFLTLFRRYWPDCPFELVVVSETGAAPGFDRVILTGRGKSWSKMLVEALNQIDSPYVMMLMNDYILDGPVDTALVLKRLDETIEKNALNYRLNPNPPYAIKNHAYAVSCQAGIWNRKFLCDLALKTESAWEFERRGSFLFDPNDPRPLLVSKIREFPFLDVIHKSYWEPHGIALMHREGIAIDLNVRGVPPLAIRCKEFVKKIVFLILPWNLIVRIQNTLNTSSVRLVAL